MVKLLSKMLKFFTALLIIRPI